MWKSHSDTEAFIRDAGYPSALARLYALSTCWRNAVYSEGYQASETWPQILSLSEAGRAALGHTTSVTSGLPEPDVLLALFGKLFHHEIFFDWDRSDLEAIRTHLEKELRSTKIRIPHRFGRLLYDRFNDLYEGSRTEHLLSADVQALLDGTPQGVAQVGHLLVGPLGVLDSLEARSLPPSLSVPLWHCSDTGCNAIHRVTLIPPRIPVVQAFEATDKALLDRDGPSSEWEHPLQWMHLQDRKEQGRPYIDLPLILSDCVVSSERTTLLQAALEGDSGESLRDIVALPPRRKQSAAGAPRDLAARMSGEEQLQLLLLLPDKQLTELLDDTVFRRLIPIPLGEIRKSRALPPRLPKDSTSQLSSLGIRSIRHHPIVNLTSAIWRAYQSCGLVNELEWRVRYDPRASSYDALVGFVRTRGPADAVRELILSSAKITQAVCDNLRISFTHAVATEEVTVDRFLWKLGLNPMLFDDSIPRFRARLVTFNETVLSQVDVEAEDAKERIRSAGVNVFVSVEEFLDLLMSYNVWLLASDHFVETQHRFEVTRARESIARVLGSTLKADGALAATWNVHGENSLGTLLAYLQASVKWMESLESLDRNALLRPDNELPHFADDVRVPFLFKHTALWADSELSELRRYLEGYATIAKLLAQADLATVRNGLDHFREGTRFPTADSMLACIARLTQALEHADINRYFPKVFWLYGRRSNRFGPEELEFRDYARRSVFVYKPPLVSGLPEAGYEHAMLISPGNLLGLPNSAVTFYRTHTSVFSKYWDGYPRKRHIPPRHDTAPEAVPVETKPRNQGTKESENP